MLASIKQAAVLTFCANVCQWHTALLDELQGHIDIFNTLNTHTWIGAVTAQRSIADNFLKTITSLGYAAVVVV